ncbi:hypothetical protein Lal_00031971 [Lupinus albus]|nr:hypothetical protein Lal_00031971 [Lupinus albus]
MATHPILVLIENMECLGASSELWYLDSDCSKHTISDKSKFFVHTPRDKGFVTYNDNNRGRILGVGRVGKPPSTTIEGVLYVERLKHNLLSINYVTKGSMRLSTSTNVSSLTNYVTHVKR